MFPLDAFRITIGKVVDIFQRHAIRYHLTGGLTTVVYGEPRMTQDIDIVTDNRAITDQLDAFYSSLEQSDFLFDSPSIRRAVEEHGMFQLFDGVEALKLDIYPRELIAGELNRSQTIEVFEGMRLPIASCADAAASKLVWVSKGSHKSRRDFRQIFRMCQDDDRRQIRGLAADLGLASLLDQLLAESDEIAD